MNEFFYGGNKILIPENALVLDVASGGNPYWRSNVLMDKFVFDNSERDADLIIDRDFIVGDVTRMPFKDKSFDFVIARHILEHLPEPEIFLKEIQRVGKAGYIETPSSFSENLFGWPFHIWEIDVSDNVLLIKTKNKNNNTQLKKMGKYFNTSSDLKEFSFKNRSMFYTQYYWENSINFKILRDGIPERAVQSLNTDLSALSLGEYRSRFSLKKKIKVLINKARRKFFDKKNINLVSLLSCVLCGGEIVIVDNNVLLCKKCAKKYDYKDSIPVIL